MAVLPFSDFRRPAAAVAAGCLRAEPPLPSAAAFADRPAGVLAEGTLREASRDLSFPFFFAVLTVACLAVPFGDPLGALPGAFFDATWRVPASVRRLPLARRLAEVFLPGLLLEVVVMSGCRHVL